MKFDLKGRNPWKKHIRKVWQDFQWPIIGGIAIVAMGIGFVGLSKYFSACYEVRSRLDIVYCVLQLFTLSFDVSKAPPLAMNWELEVARFLSPAIAAYAAVRAFTAIFREQINLLHVQCVTDHIVICGLGKKGMLLCQKFRQHDQQVVVIELDEGNTFLDQCKDQGVSVMPGDARDREMLLKARVHKAKYLISVCGDDGVNADVAVHARELVRDHRGNVLTCIIHLVDPYLCHLLEEQELETGRRDNCRLEFFNIFDSGARSWLEDYSPFTDAGGKRVLNPRLLIVGIGLMGERLVINAARNWKDMPHQSGEKLHITLIDKEAVRKKELLLLRYPRLAKVCELLPRQMEIESSTFQAADFLFDRNGTCTVTSIFVCLDNDSFGLSTALALHRRTREYAVPIVVRMGRDAGLATLLRGGRKVDESLAMFHAFALMDRTCQPEQVLSGTNEILARAIHEDYKERQGKKGQTPESNPSMVAWEELPQSLKESNRQQADHIGIKLRELGCTLVPLTDWDEKLFEFTQEEIETIARKEHERWVEERRRSGWKPGPEKDIKKKITPYLVSWEDLDDDIREEDRNPVRNLPKYLARIGYTIYRKKTHPLIQ
ncbi:MAG: NAD-binding protein [bacterium]